MQRPRFSYHAAYMVVCWVFRAQTGKKASRSWEFPLPGHTSFAQTNKQEFVALYGQTSYKKYQQSMVTYGVLILFWLFFSFV